MLNLSLHNAVRTARVLKKIGLKDLQGELKKLASISAIEYEDETAQVENRALQIATGLDFIITIVLNAGDAEKELGELICQITGDEGAYENPDSMEILQKMVEDFIDLKENKKDAISFFKSALTQAIQK